MGSFKGIKDLVEVQWKWMSDFGMSSHSSGCLSYFRDALKIKLDKYQSCVVLTGIPSKKRSIDNTNWGLFIWSLLSAFSVLGTKLRVLRVLCTVHMVPEPLEPIVCLMVKLDFAQAIKRALSILKKILVKRIFLEEWPLKNRKREKFTQTRMERYIMPCLSGYMWWLWIVSTCLSRTMFPREIPSLCIPGLVRPQETLCRRFGRQKWSASHTSHALKVVQGFRCCGRSCMLSCTCLSIT